MSQTKTSEIKTEELTILNNEDIEYEPTMTPKIIKLISEKYNIPLDNKLLQQVLHILEKRECTYKKLDKNILKTSRIKKDKLSEFGISDINKEIIDALCNPNYNSENLKPLTDIELFTDYVDTTQYNTPEFQLITFLKWCSIYADYKSYIPSKDNKKFIKDFKFKSNNLEEVIAELKELDNELFDKINTLAYNLSGGYIDLSEEEFNMEINWCNKFMENRFAKIIMPSYPNSNLYKQWCKFLDKPIIISKHNEAFENLKTIDESYYKFLTKLFKYHYNIASFKANPVIMPHQKCSEKSSAFAQSLLSYQYNETRDIKKIFNETSSQYYMKNDISERLTCMYKRCSFDLDVNKNTFELPKLKQDLSFIINYLLEPIDNIGIYYAIDFNKNINYDMVINELDKLIESDKNKTHKHNYKYWVLDQSKDISIHIYVTGVIFTDIQLFGLSRIILQAINNYYLFYIDASTYKTGSQQFRCPYSGKMACGRLPIVRTDDKHNKKDLIKFYKKCSVYPSKEDVYCNKFECFVQHCNDKCTKKRFIKNSTTVSVFSANNKKTIRKIKDIEALYTLEPINFDKATQLLIDMQIQTVQKIYGYEDHRKARLILLNNVIALGGNIANILEINSQLGINHTNGTNTINTQSDSDCNWILSNSNSSSIEFKYRKKLLYKNDKPIIFPLNKRVKEVLFETPLSNDIIYILVQHYYAFIGAKHIYYFDTHLNQSTGQPDIVLQGPFSTPNQMPVDKFNIYTENGLISINPYNYFSSPSIKMHRYNTIGFCNNDDCLNTYSLDIPEIKEYKSFEELYIKYPEFYKLLYRVFNNSNYEKQEINNRIEYFLTSICYAIQNPQKVKPKGLLITTQNSAGKSSLMNLIKDCFDDLVLTGRSLNTILSDSFNNYLINKVIVCCEEIKTNQDYDKLKDWMDNKTYTINQKCKDIIEVRNTSIKIFLTNNTNFNFITESDRRFVIFLSNIQYPNKIDDDITKILNESEYRTKFINYLRDYLINYDTKDFNPNNPDFIPQSCIAQYKSICEDNDNANERCDIGLIKLIYKSCVTPTFKNDSKKVMSLHHILDVINIVMCKNKLTCDFKELDINEKKLFINEETYNKLLEFTQMYFDIKKQSWYINRIAKIFTNQQHFEKCNYRPKQLNIPEEIQEKYNTAQIKVIKYLI